MPPHFLVLTYPAQGHMNPALHFACRLARTGHRVTFTSTVFGHTRLLQPPTTPDDNNLLLSYAPFSDGYDDGFDFDKDGERFMAHLAKVAPAAVNALLRDFARDGFPVTCVVYTMLLSWATDVAHDAGIPSSLLWIQPASVFVIYHHYFHSSDAFLIPDLIKLPGLPPLTRRDLPSFIFPTDSYPFVLSSIKLLFQALDREEEEEEKPPQVLVNTFDALEDAAMRSIDSVQMAGVGPLVPASASDKTNSGDEYYIQWLDSKPKSSVVYVSFGTLSTLSKRQMEEISNGLSESGRHFLWVVRETQKGSADAENIGVYSCERGLVVPWCSQVEVLSHPSVGCFLSHCGWNSTTESLAAGVPMVCFPQWSDQLIIAKLVEEVWKTGVRVEVGEDDGVLKGGELKMYLEEVMEGKRGEEMRKKAEEWRDKAREAGGEGGSSYRNVKAFVDKVNKRGVSS